MSFHNNEIELAGIVTVGPKGQIVIPVEVRQNMEISPGDRLVALYLSKQKAVGFVSEHDMQQLINKMGDHLTTLQERIG